MPVKTLYIMSSPRGGSTLLSLVLGQHPRIANLGEVCYIPKLLSLGEHCTCGSELRECSEWGRVFADLASRTGVDMRLTPYGLHLDDAMKWKDGTGKVDHKYQSRKRVALARFRGAMDTIGLDIPRPIGGAWLTLPSLKEGARNTMRLFSSAANVWDKDVIVDASKLPRKAVHLYREFPDDVRILHLTRDGRGVSASRMTQNMPFERAVKRWKHYHSLTKKLLDKWVDPAHYYSMKYEEFTTDPELHMQELCQWLGVPYDKQMLEFGQDTVMHSAGGNPTRFKLADEGIRPMDDRWRTKLTEENIRHFEEIAGGLNRGLGYPGI
ncbi:MAG: sulfotransferase [Gammaproteobacteria bacterium]